LNESVRCSNSSGGGVKYPTHCVYITVAVRRKHSGLTYADKVT